MANLFLLRQNSAVIIAINTSVITIMAIIGIAMIPISILLELEVSGVSPWLIVVVLVTVEIKQNSTY